MKKSLFIFLLLCMSIPVLAEGIAVVDLQHIVSASSQVKQLKNEHTKQIKELEKIIINARGEIANEKDAAKVLLLEDKYTREFNIKKEAIDADYNNKLVEIEKNIKLKIADQAKKLSYDYVFAKSVVLFGGSDITDEIINTIK